MLNNLETAKISPFNKGEQMDPQQSGRSIGSVETLSTGNFELVRERLFPESAIQTFKDIPAELLQHRFSNGRLNSRSEQIDFAQVTDLLQKLNIDVQKWYEAKFSRAFNSYELGACIDEVRQKFYTDPRFQLACAHLEITKEQYSAIRLPWWNVMGLAETGFDSSQLRAELGPRHSYETQIMRAGFALPIRNVSVAGLILTRPEQEGASPQVMIGLRAGNSFPMTYHLFAGALRATPGMISGSDSIFDTYVRTELLNELSLAMTDIVQARLQAHLYETAIENGAYYVFRIDTGLKKEQLMARWMRNQHVDRAEHSNAIFLDCTREEIFNFLESSYRGLVKDDPARTAERAFTLHPTALALASLAGIDAAEVAALVMPGIW